MADAFEHHAWATVRLIDTCLDLSAEQLATAATGIYGPIIGTMRHLVDAEAAYLFWLTGDRAHLVDADAMDLRALRDAIERDGVAWSILLAEDPDPARIVKEIDQDDGYERDASVGIRLAQAIRHGTDHRSQICTALTNLGVEPPSIDVWDFGVTTGRIVEVLPQSQR